MPLRNVVAALLNTLDDLVVASLAAKEGNRGMKNYNNKNNGSGKGFSILVPLYRHLKYELYILLLFRKLIAYNLLVDLTYV